MSLTSKELIPYRLEMGLPVDECFGTIDLKKSGIELSRVKELEYDVMTFKVNVLGHQEKFPRPYDWENLIATLGPDEELLWIVKKSRKSVDVYLALKFLKGLSGTDRQRRFRELEHLFQSKLFPESHTEQAEAIGRNRFKLESLVDPKSVVTVVSGLPSAKAQKDDELFQERDEEQRSFADLNTIVEPFIKDADSSFTIVFSMSKATADELRAEMVRKTELRDKIHPLVEIQKTISEGSVDTIVDQVTHAEQENETVNEKRNLLSSLLQALVGSNKGGNWGTKCGTGYSSGTATAKTSGGSKASQETESDMVKQINSELKLVDDILETSLNQFMQCLGTGGYHASACVYSKDQDLSRRLGLQISSALSGAKTRLCPFRMTTYSKGQALFQFSHKVPTYKVIPETTLLNSEQAGMFLMLPSADLPGLRLKKSVFYGRPKSAANVGVFLGHQAFNDDEYKIGYDDVCHHLFLTGTTGSGKTTRASAYLNSLPLKKFKVLSIETAKKTYRNKLCREVGGKPYEKTVYTLGNSSANPLRINPFFFEPKTSLKRHISVLSDALSNLLPMESLIGPKLREAVMNVYFKFCWDVETGEYCGDGSPRYPTVMDFNEEIACICDALNYSAELNQNYRGALEGRAKLFIDDLYQDIFCTDGNRTIDELLGDDTIIEMEDLPPSEINMPAFIVSILLERIRESRKIGKNEREQVIVIEEAHNVLHQRHEEEKGQRETAGGKHLIDQIVRLLQEGRELGIGVVVIDQSATSLAQTVIQNTNTKIIHRLEDGQDMEAVGKCLGMTEDEWHDLQMLDDGECVVKTKKSFKPVKLAKLTQAEVDRCNDKASKFELPTCKPHSYYRAMKTLERLKDATSMAMLKAIADETFAVCDEDEERFDYVLRRFRQERLTDRPAIRLTGDESPLEKLVLCSPTLAPEKVVLNYMVFLFRERDGQAISESEVSGFLGGMEHTSPAFRKAYLATVDKAMGDLFTKYCLTEDPRHLVDNSFLLIFNDAIGKTIAKGVDGGLTLSDVRRSNARITAFQNGHPDNRRRIHSLATIFLDNTGYRMRTSTF